MATPKGLPRETFAKLTPHPYLLANLKPESPSVKPSRSNGRAPGEARPASSNTSSLTHAHGSALVRVGDNTVICGVRGEILPVGNIPNYRPSEGDSAEELLDYDLLVPNIELSTGSAPEFLPGGPPTTLAQTLSARVFSLLHSSKLITADDLRIWHTRPTEDADAIVATGTGDDDGEDTNMMATDEEEEKGQGEKVVIAYWVLYIDIFFLSFDGNPFDVAWISMLAALGNTKLPAARWDADREMVICTRAEQKPLSLSGFPIPCTAVVFTGKDTEKTPADDEFWVLVDPDRLEETLCDETITVVVDKTSGTTKLLSISKHGGTALQPDLIKNFVKVAEQRWEELRRVLA
ncbi:exosome complex exonuclease RRP43 [Sodiomyces alkalinus F11]|uniref:Ribosomal RNA-processing protein 43 n=1 Tax=Sodiomyces alkalinus (strain CBS 110278 / VKM F-3762 / F11) TaxID=1314773 RepID=A0A3N2Q2F7_SODAK|nr:exosome complex exonuclease RRP43 [Sodiomyces alkalinus F11]ROT40943.1 exosome complex exonuclease RRP43 [Sodiomyces alkalinus F11]